MIKLCADELAVILAEMVNSSFKGGTFHNDMEHAEFSPLLKRKKV